MRPSAAEVARTLVRGRLHGTLRFADGTSVKRFHHATDGAGRPLVLAAPGDELTVHLRSDHHGGAAPVWLTVDDVPPHRYSPSLGRLRLCGTLRPVPRVETKPAVLDFAQSNPVEDLFEVGQRIAMLRIEPERIWLARFGTSELVDPAEYTEAEPDPLHDSERDLLDDLADHHTIQLHHQIRRLLEDAGATCRGQPRVRRLDRYGMVIDLGDDDGTRSHGRWVRLEFARAVRSQHDLAHLLHPILFHHHRGHHRGPQGCD